MATSTAIIRLLIQAQGNGAELTNAELTAVINKLKSVEQKNSQTTAKMIQEWNRVAQQIGSSVRQLGQAFMNAGMTMTLATAPIALVGKQGIEVAQNWDQAMASIATVTGKTKDSVINDMKKTLDEVKNWTFGVQSTADVVLALTKAGFDLADAQELARQGAVYTTATFDGAERSAANYANTTEQLAAALRAFYGPEAAGKARESIDLLTKVMNTAAADAADFNQAFVALFPTAKLAGMTLEETAIAIGLLSDKGIRGSKAGRQTSSALMTMVQDMPKVTNAFKKLGISITDESGNLNNLRTIIGDLNKAVFGSGDAQLKASVGFQQASAVQIKAMKDADDALATFRARQLENTKRMEDEAAALKGRSAEEVAAYKAAIEASRGTTEEVESKTRALTKNSALWDKLTPKMRTWIGQLRDSAETANKNTDKYEALAGANQKLLTVNGKVSEVERIRILRAISTQVGLRSLVPLIEGGTDAWDRYADALKDAETAEESAQKKLDNFKDSVGKLKSTIEAAMVKAFVPIIDKFLKPLVQKLKEAVDRFDRLSQPVKELIIGFGAFLVALGPLLFIFGSFLFTLGMTIQGLSGLATVITTMIIPNLGALTLVFAPLLAVFGAVVLGIAGVASALIDNTNGVRDAMAGPFATITGHLSDLKAWLADKIPQAVQAMKSFFTNLGAELLKGINFKAIFDEVDKLRKALGELFEKMFGKDATKVVEIREVGGKGKEEMVRITGLQKMAEEFGGGIGKVLANITNVIVPGFIQAITDATTAISEHIPKWVAMTNQHMPKIAQSGKDLQAAFDSLARALGLFAPSGEGGSVFSNLLDLMTAFADMGAKLNIEIFNKLAAAIDALANALKALKSGDFIGTIASLTDVTIKTTPAGWFGELIFGKKSASETLGELRKRFDEVNAVSNQTQTNITNEWGLLPETMTATAAGMRTGVKDEFTGLYNDLVGRSIVPDTVNNILLWMNNLKLGWDSVWNGLFANASTVMTNTLLYVGQFSALIQPIWTGLITSISTTWNAFWNSLGNQVTQVLGVDVKKAVEDQFHLFKSLGENLIGKMVEGIQGAIEGLIDAMVNAVGAAIKAAQKAVAGWSPNIGSGGTPPGKAAGGPVYSGRTYVVGEAGPELFTPKMSGNIIPNSMLNAMNGGGHTTNQNNTYQLNYSSSGGNPISEKDLRRMFELMEMSANLGGAA